MRTFLPALCFLCLISFGLTAQNSAYVSTEKTLPSFSSVIIDLPVNIEIDGSKNSKAILVASAADMKKISWEVEDETLVIKEVDGMMLEGPVNFSIGNTQVARVESTEEAVIYMHHLERERLDLDLLKGAIKLEGKVAQLHLRVESAKVYATDLTSRAAYVNMWDEGNIILTATEVLKVDATNNGKVIYVGEPAEITKNLSNGAVALSKEQLDSYEGSSYVNFQLQ